MRGTHRGEKTHRLRDEAARLQGPGSSRGGGFLCDGLGTRAGRVCSVVPSASGELGPPPRPVSTAPGPCGGQGLLVTLSCAGRAPSFGPSTHPELTEGQWCGGNFGVLSWRHAEVWGSTSVPRGLVRGPLGLGAGLEQRHRIAIPTYRGSLSGFVLLKDTAPQLEHPDPSPSSSNSPIADPTKLILAGEMALIGSRIPLP